MNRDIRFENHGSIFTVTGLTHAGRGWLAENLPEDAMRWGAGYVVEPRYVEAIAEGAVGYGLEVE